MKMIIKIILALAALYVVIGIVQAIQFSLAYDPTYTSAPNNVPTFIMNVLFWPADA